MSHEGKSSFILLHALLLLMLNINSICILYPESPSRQEQCWSVGVLGYLQDGYPSVLYFSTAKKRRKHIVILLFMQSKLAGRVKRAGRRIRMISDILRRISFSCSDLKVT